MWNELSVPLPTIPAAFYGKLRGKSIFRVCAYSSPQHVFFELLAVTVGPRVSLLVLEPSH